MPYTMEEKKSYLKQKKAWDKKNKTPFISFGMWLNRKGKSKKKTPQSKVKGKKGKFTTTRTKGLMKALYGSIGKKATERMRD